MIFGLFRKKPHEATVERLHTRLVEHSRLPAFFLPPYGAADTFEGRFEVLVLNAGLLLRRLGAAPAPGPEVAQELSNAIFSHFDDALREIGISDVGVPKKIKKLARAFMGRGIAYTQAAAQGQTALAEALSRNVLSGGGDGAAFADYFMRAGALLDSTPADVFMRGEAPFPAP